MPIKMNLVEACKFKKKHPSNKVYYKHEDGNEFYTEELTEFREEFRFDLDEGKYPNYYDHESFGESHFYNRHIFGEIHAETDEEALARMEAERLRVMREKEKKKKELDAQIAQLKKEREKLDN